MKMGLLNEKPFYPNWLDIGHPWIRKIKSTKQDKPSLGLGWPYPTI
jgi:hypothetical protein